jgi:hypothetical protein
MMKRQPLAELHADDPALRQRSPYAAFLLSLCLLAALPLVEGDPSVSTTIDAVGRAVAFLWGFCLLAGSMLALVGVFFPTRSWRVTWDILLVEMAGAILVGGGALFYTYEFYNAVGLPGHRFTIAITAAFGLASLWRVVQIVIRLRWIRRTILRRFP